MAIAKGKKPEAETRNWYQDRYQAVAVQRKLLSAITLIALSATMLTVLVIAWLTPLKSVEPFVIQVDQKSGITQVVEPIRAVELTANESVNNFFIVQYIRAREGYDSNSLIHEYDIVRVLSDGGVYKAFSGTVDPNNPKSPIATLGNVGKRNVQFKSISYIKPQLAQARIEIEESRGEGSSFKINKIVLIGFDYVKMMLSPEERYINPLGFQVNDYRIDEDVLPQ